MSEYRADLIDVAMCLHAESDKAYFASDCGDKAKAVWLPKSQVEIVRTKDGNILATMPSWLAKEKGLI